MGRLSKDKLDIGALSEKELKTCSYYRMFLDYTVRYFEEITDDTKKPYLISYEIKDKYIHKFFISMNRKAGTDDFVLKFDAILPGDTPRTEGYSIGWFISEAGNTRDSIIEYLKEDGTEYDVFYAIEELDKCARNHD